MRTFRNIVAVLLVFGCLGLGVTIYLSTRPGTLPVNHWFGSLTFLPRLEFSHLSAWAINSLPDALWMFALSMSILLLWKFRWNRGSIFWYALALILGLGIEAAQAIHLVRGTYDPLDLISIHLAGAIPIVFTLQFNRHAKSPVH